MKDLLINLLAGLIMTSLAFIVQGAINHADGNMVDLCAGVIAVIIVSSLCITLWCNHQRGKFLAAQKFDFKFFADAKQCEPEALAKLFAMFDLKGVEGVGSVPKYAKPQSAVDGKINASYLSAEKFFSSENELLMNFRCQSVRNKQKAGKVFLQLSFVPLDADSKTIVIHRSDIYHPGRFGVRLKQDLSFVSFSPIPPRYDATKFSVLDSYYNEVPEAWGSLAGIKPVIKELGAVVLKNKNGAIYVFWVFAAQYPSCIHFDGPSVDSKKVLNELFYENEAAVEDKLPFVKDHDTIAVVLDVKALKAYALNGTLPEYSWNPLNRKFWKILRERLILRRLTLKDMEKCVLENFF